MSINHINGKWILPTGVDELLPPQAEAFAALQQRILGVFFSYGYQLFNPSLVEFSDSLVIDKTDELEQEIVKFMDQPSGEQLGLRADFTPQAARVEASTLRHDKPNRICYCGEVFRNHSEYDQFRNQVQAGVELFGDKSIKSDKEVVFLLVDCLSRLSDKKLVLDLGHAQVWRCLVKLAGLSCQEREKYFRLLTSKQVDRLAEFVRVLKVPAKLRPFLIQLPRLYGDEKVLKEAKKMTGTIGSDELDGVLHNIQSIVRELKRQTNVEIFVDLGEMPGGSYSYHNGLVFGAYFADKPHCFAKGGRYDTIAESYGGVRAATGFSIDLRSLFYYLAERPRHPRLIFSPHKLSDPSLQETIKKLRSHGRRVVCALNARQDARLLDCREQLVKKRGRWIVEAVSE